MLKGVLEEIREVKVNKHLTNAARYLDAVHDIQIDEHHPKLAKVVEKYVSELKSETLDKYWNLYLQDIGAAFDELSELTETQESDEYEEKTIMYRGRKETVRVKKEDKSDSKIVYRGSKE